MEEKGVLAVCLNSVSLLTETFDNEVKFHSTSIFLLLQCFLSQSVLSYETMLSVYLAKDFQPGLFGA